MPSMLYLDAARMGQMAPSAQWALHDFVRLAGEEGCTLYFEQVLPRRVLRLAHEFPIAIPWIAIMGRHRRTKTSSCCFCRTAVTRTMCYWQGGPPI